MFSRVFPSLDSEIRSITARASRPSAERTEEILREAAQRPLNLRELAELLETGACAEGDEPFRLLRAFTSARFREPAGNHFRYVAPIYLSSYCVDSCGYCNFSSARKTTARKRLGLEEFENELAGVLASGARVIELVLGTDPELPWPSLAPYVSRTAGLLAGEPGSAVLLCSDHFPDEAYPALRDAGLAGTVQWDETLDRDAYRRWHGASPRKRNFEARMDAHDRALAAGLEVATGALFGLADLRYETLMQIAKARFFGQEYGRKPFVFGTARLKPIEGQALPSSTGISDQAYETALMVYRIAEPGVGRWLQTRETFDLNLRNALDRDAFTYRCGDVRPGGYGASAQASGGQFEVNELSRSDVEERLRSVGFHIEYAWWGRNGREASPAYSRERSGTRISSQATAANPASESQPPSAG